MNTIPFILTLLSSMFILMVTLKAALVDPADGTLVMLLFVLEA